MAVAVLVAAASGAAQAQPFPPLACTVNAYGSFQLAGGTTMEVRQINPSTGIDTLLVPPSPVLPATGNSLAITPDGLRVYYANTFTGALRYLDVASNTDVDAGANVGTSRGRMGTDPSGAFGYSAGTGVVTRFTTPATGPSVVTALTVQNAPGTPAGLEFASRPGGDLAVARDGSVYFLTRRGGTGANANDSFLYRGVVVGTTLTMSFLGVISPAAGAANAPFSTLDNNGIAFVGEDVFTAGENPAIGSPYAVYRVDLRTLTATLVYRAPAGGQTPIDLAGCVYPSLAPVVSASKTAAIVTPAGATAAQTGSVLEYTITARNTGNVSASNARFADAIPAGTSYVAGSTTLNGTAVADVGGAMPFATERAINTPGQPLGVLAPDQTPAVLDREAVIRFRVTVNAGTTSVSNQGTVLVAEAPQPIRTDDPALPGAGDPTVTPVDLAADMAAAITGFPATAAAGSTVTGTVTCTNNGPNPATAATCAVTGLPAGATVTCTPTSPAASLASGSSMGCAVSFTAPVTGTVTVTGTAGSLTADAVPANNVATQPVGVTEQADMLAQTTVPSGVVAGQTVTVSGVCTNAGLSAAAAPTCVLSGLPAGATQTCIPSPAPNPLTVGSSITCTSTFAAPADLGAGGSLNITTTAGSSTADPAPGNNVDIEALAITPQADMQAATSGFPSNPPAGSNVTGSVLCTNAGPSPAASPTCNVAGAPAGARIICTPSPAPNPLPVGGQISCAVSYTAPPVGGVTLTGTAGSTTDDPNSANNTAQTTQGVAPQADMQATVTAPATANAGQTVNVSGACTNAGPSPAANATCALSGLPAGTPQVCTPNPAPNPLAVGSAITCTASFTAPASGSLSITSTAGSGTDDPNPANSSASTPVTVTPQADVAAAVSGFPSNPTAGSTASGTVSCTNNGPSTAVNATCAVSGLPAGAGVSCTPATPVASLALGQTIMCAVSYPVPASGAVTVTGTAGSSTADPVAGNNVVTASQTVGPQADMQAQTSVPASIAAGQSVTVSGTCTNAGPSAAAAPTCALSGLPAGATQTCVPSPAPNPLAVGAGIACTSTFTAPANLGPGGSLSITTTAGTSTADPVAGNNTDTAPLAIVPQADMQATATGFLPNPPAGSTDTGAITCTNNGPSPAPNASCNVTIVPAGGSVTCTPNPAPNPLPVGSSISCAVSYTVPPTGAVTVSGVADSDVADPTPGNNTAQAATAVAPRADMQATVSAPATVNAGQSVTVSGTCTNAGPSQAQAASCELSGLPPGAPQACTPNPVPDPLPVGSTITCTSTFTAPSSGTLAISTIAGSLTADDLAGNNSAQAPLAIVEQADMRAAVSGLPSNPPAGSPVSGAVTCTNAGPSPATAATCAVTGAPAGATITCSPSTPTAAPLGVGESISCTVGYIAPAGGGAITITGTAGSGTADPVPGNNVADSTSTVVQQADMQATLSGLPADPAAGSAVTGTAVCTNNGPSPAAAPTCVVAGLPAGATTTCTRTPAPNPLAVGSSISCAIGFTAPPTGAVTVQATAGSSTTDPIPGNNQAVQPLSVLPVADMAAAFAGLPANAAAGVPVSGTLTCTNNGPSPAANPSCVVSGVPTGATVSCTPSPAPASLAVGAAITCTIGFTPTASGAITITGQAGSSTFDPNRANNIVGVTTGAINAVNDSGSVPNGRAPQVVVPNVLANDTLNGSPATLANVTLRQTATSNPLVTLDPATGAVNTAANTPAGSYTVSYEICTRASPVVCDTATATVTVGQAAIDAVNDPTFFAGPAGGQVNLLGNDTLGGAPVVAADLTITLTANGGLTGLSLDAQGNAIVPPNTTPGSYTATYQICERLNPANCNTATVPIVVQAPISGSVWFDSGSVPRNREPAEGGLQGWTVEAVFPPGHPQAGQVAPGLNGQPATALTGSDGGYQIDGLAPGNYQLRFRSPGVGGQPGAVYGTPVNGESGNPQPGSTLNTASRTLDITVGSGAASAIAQQSLPVDPSGVLYDAITRQPVTGATLRLVGPNGQPVPADQLLPNQQDQAVVASGPAAGSYRFDLLPNAPRGVYRIEVTPPAGYSAPSVLLPPAPRLAFQPGPGVYAVVPGIGAPAAGQPTIYHLEVETGPGSADIVHNHIPLDPAVLPQLAIQKVANKAEAQIGDRVRYTLTVRNLSTTLAVPNVNVVDSLPLGFVFEPGTVRRPGVPPVALPNPTINGRVLGFALGNLAAGTQTEFSYAVRLGSLATEGDGINRAYAQSGTGSGGRRSLTAQATVRVGGGVFREEACFVGKIYADCGNRVGQGNGNGIQDAGEPGIPGVRLYLEDGAYVVSDSEGKYSYCGLRARTHVLKVDDTTLPPGTRLGTTSNRNAGDPGSLFIDLKKGEIMQADFRDMSCQPGVAAEIERRRSELRKQKNGDVNDAQIEGQQPAGPGLGQERGQTPANPSQKGGVR